nr:MAG TPA: hypothetical protein [Caudoviricetes sp.]
MNLWQASLNSTSKSEVRICSRQIWIIPPQVRVLLKLYKK